MMEPGEVGACQHPSEDDSGKSQIVPSAYRYVQRPTRTPIPIQPVEPQITETKEYIPGAPIDLQDVKKNSKALLFPGASIKHKEDGKTVNVKSTTTKYISLAEEKAGHDTNTFLNDKETDWSKFGVECLPSSPQPERTGSLVLDKKHKQFQYVDEPVNGKVVYGQIAVMEKFLEVWKLCEENTGVICDKQKLVVNKNLYVMGENFEEPYPLGHGSFGHVSFTTDKISKTTMVRKEINCSKTGINPKEILIPLSLNHPAIVKIFGCINCGPNYLEIFMEFGGFSLDKVVEDESLRRLLVEQAIIDIGCQGYQVLDELQRMGVMHLDIKPQNLLINWDNKQARFHLKLCDFGAARHVDDPIVPHAWTPAYMAPEMCRHVLSLVDEKLCCTWSDEEKVISPQADVYSFASSLLFLCYWMHCIPKVFQGCKDMDLICKVARTPTVLLRFIQNNWDARLQKVLIGSFCEHPQKRIKPREAFQLLSGTPALRNFVVRSGMKRKSCEQRLVESMEVEYSPAPCKRAMPSQMEDDGESTPSVESLQNPQLDYPPPQTAEPCGNLPCLGILLEED